MDADIDGRAESGEVRDDPRECHAGSDILKLAHAIGEPKHREGIAWIAPRLGQFSRDILEGRQADFFRDIRLYIEALALRVVVQ